MRLWIVIGLLVGVWLAGVLLRVAGRLIHFVLVLAIVLLIWRLAVRGRPIE